MFDGERVLVQWTDRGRTRRGCPGAPAMWLGIARPVVHALTRGANDRIREMAPVKGGRNRFLPVGCLPRRRRDAAEFRRLTPPGDLVSAGCSSSSKSRACRGTDASIVAMYEEAARGDVRSGFTPSTATIRMAAAGLLDRLFGWPFETPSRCPGWCSAGCGAVTRTDVRYPTPGGPWCVLYAKPRRTL